MKNIKVKFKRTNNSSVVAISMGGRLNNNSLWLIVRTKQIAYGEHLSYQHIWFRMDHNS